MTIVKFIGSSRLLDRASLDLGLSKSQVTDLGNDRYLVTAETERSLGTVASILDTALVPVETSIVKLGKEGRPYIGIDLLDLDRLSRWLLNEAIVSFGTLASSIQIESFTTDYLFKVLEEDGNQLYSSINLLQDWIFRVMSKLDAFLDKLSVTSSTDYGPVELFSRPPPVPESGESEAYGELLAVVSELFKGTDLDESLDDLALSIMGGSGPVVTLTGHWMRLDSSPENVEKLTFHAVRIWSSLVRANRWLWPSYSSVTVNSDLSIRMPVLSGEDVTRARNLANELTEEGILGISRIVDPRLEVLVVARFLLGGEGLIIKSGSDYKLLTTASKDSTVKLSEPTSFYGAEAELATLYQVNSAYEVLEIRAGGSWEEERWQEDMAIAGVLDWIIPTSEGKRLLPGLIGSEPSLELQVTDPLKVVVEEDLDVVSYVAGDYIIFDIPMADHSNELKDQLVNLWRRGLLFTLLGRYVYDTRRGVFDLGLIHIAPV